MKKIIYSLILLILTAINVRSADIPILLQDISVTVKSSSGSGSGVIFTRTNSAGELINFVWTAAHVTAANRSERMVISPDGTKKTVVEFADASVIKILTDNGRAVGKLEMDCEIIKYSDADNGEDLCLMRLRKTGFVKVSTTFYLDKTIPSLGTDLYHVGSLLGEMGANSMTSGIVSQHGRLINKKVYDQTTTTSFPGCLTGDTKIQLGDGTEININQLKQEDSVLTYDDRVIMADGTWSNLIEQGSQVLSYQTIIGQLEKKKNDHNLRPIARGKVVKVWSTGVKPILKISTRNKTVRATENHPFVKIVSVPSINKKNYLITQWCPAGELKVGDVVAVMNQHIQYKKSNGLNLTKEFGPPENHKPMMRLLGFYVGDGYSRIRKGFGGEVSFYTFNNEDSDRYSQIIKQCFNLNATRVKNVSGEFLQVYNLKMAQKINELGVCGYATTKRIPQWVFQLPPELQTEFLEGLIDADGHRRRDSWQIELANKQLIEDIYALATNLGMGTSNISNRKREVELDGRLIQSETWSCEIYPNPVHLNSYIGGTKELLPSGLAYERISSIIPDGEEMTYDMEVASFHNFFANGFLVHNSSGGGVFLRDGRYMGMLVRGAGEGFCLIVPVRRIHEWAQKAKVEWALDYKIPLPSEEALKSLSVEDNPFKK